MARRFKGLLKKELSGVFVALNGQSFRAMSERYKRNI
jgi:hypothetical protein